MRNPHLQPPRGWEHVRRLLVVRLDNIGDIVMLGPALRTLRQALPQASITLLASPAGSQVTPLLPWVDDVIVERTLWQDADGRLPFEPRREQALIEAIHEQRFDAAIIFTSFSQTPFPPAYACYLAGIPIRLGQSTAFGGGVLSHQVRPLPPATQQVERNLHLLEASGFEVTERALELSISPETQDEADRLLAAHGIDRSERFVALAPGASALARRYDPDRFAEAARMIASETAMPVVVLGSERESALAQRVVDRLHGVRVTSLAGQTPLPVLAAVIGPATVLLANNSGPMHLADALGCPMVITYAGTDLEEQWRPKRAPTVLLRRETDCSPCYRFTCPFDMQCLDIPPREVAEAALGVIEGVGVAP